MADKEIPELSKLDILDKISVMTMPLGTVNERRHSRFSYVEETFIYLPNVSRA